MYKYKVQFVQTSTCMSQIAAHLWYVKHNFHISALRTDRNFKLFICMREYVYE